MAYLDLVNDRYALTPSRHPPQDQEQDAAPPAAAEPELLATAQRLPLSMLPGIATMLDDELADAEELQLTLSAARAKPHVLDAATLARVKTLYTDQLRGHIAVLDVAPPVLHVQLTQTKRMPNRGGTGFGFEGAGIGHGLY